mmetsp:Transcript_6406/g.23739  ORF Transcript_6406/g.23739 Transcript_6406/m.23739 type:complete len:101 (-) Transcript_6406:264-566(-)
MQTARAILSEDKDSIDEVLRKVDDLGRELVDMQEWEAAGFVLCMRGLLTGVIVDNAFALEGVYAAGYAKVYGLISDSGWRMVREADEADEEEDLADTSDK